MGDPKENLLEDPKVEDLPSKEEFETLKQQNADLVSKVDKVAQELASERQKREKIEAENWVNGPKMLKKIRTDQRQNALNIGIALRGIEASTKFLLAGKEKELSIYDAFLSFCEGQSDFVSMKEVGGDVQDITDGPDPFGDPKKERHLAVQRYAKEKNIDMSTIEGLTKAENGARQAYPEVFKAPEVN